MSGIVGGALIDKKWYKNKKLFIRQ